MRFVPDNRGIAMLTHLSNARKLATLIAGVVILTSTGCTSMRDWVHNGLKVGPNYAKPPAPVADDWIDSKTKGVNTGSPQLDEWWKVFNDKTLNRLVIDAYRQNLDLRTAGTRILAARAQRNIAAGNLFPQKQEARLDIDRFGVSGNIANLPPGFTRFFDNNAVGFNLQWEIDFWGRFRRGIEAADAELDATIENYDDVLVLLLAEVASNYVQYRTSQQRLAYAVENIEQQSRLVKAAEDRLKGGVGDSPKLDQAQSRSNLTNTLALKEQLEIGLRLANNRLCILLGIPVRDLAPELGKAPIPETPPEVAVGMPVELLRRRPDLRRAERLVAAQSARIGIATSDLYPRFVLFGQLGYEAKNFTDLFQSKSFFGDIGPRVQWDILNYGRLLNGIRVQDALFQTRVLDYQSAVLRAGREVEDGIVLFLRAHEQTRNLKTSVAEAIIAAQDAETLSVAKKFDVNRQFVTSNFKTGQQDALAVAQGDIAQGLIQVYRAMGGGWQIRFTPPETVEVIPAPQDKLPMPQKMSNAPARFMPPRVAQNNIGR
jgi:NodT family efflux transporter outer membrane factor (OMF) lipoprotein